MGRACGRDIRCIAAANVDGYLYGDVVDHGLSQPFLYLASEAGDSCDLFYRDNARTVEALATNRPNGAHVLTITGTRHFNFSDYAVLFSPVLKPQRLLGPIDGERGLHVTADYLLAFFGNYLSDDKVLRPSESLPVSPEVRVGIR